MNQNTDKPKLVYNFICDPRYKPIKFKEIAHLMQVSKEDRQALRDALHTLMANDKVILLNNGKYIKGKAPRLTGHFQAHAKGFGFIIPDEGTDGDVFISEHDVRDAMDGDKVEYFITRNPGDKRQEGKIVKVIERKVQKIVGLFEKSKSFGFVRPDNPKIADDIYIPEGKINGAVTGQKVVVELTSYGDATRKPEGKVDEIIGFLNAPGTDILSIVKDFGLPTEFPEKVLNQAERVGSAVTEADRLGRLDLRQTDMVTIDGEDAKDLDDAVSLTKDGENFVLGVHIADVANYVQERSALDKEALKRGTSVYLVDRVIPMLPPKLSNGICSLNPQVDRLTLSCIMTINPKGEVVDHLLAETVINTRQRMTYTDVAKILTKEEPAIREQYKDLSPMFDLMGELSLILREKRTARGSINFDFPESKILLDEDGTPVAIKAYEANAATRLIEDFMLLANETVAEEYFWRELPFLYRNHEAPEEDKIKKLSLFLNNFGYHLRLQNELRPKEIQKLITQISDTPEEAMISRLTLRSMRQARYAPDNVGHFGLAAKYYSHFTSPIRRYPDLQIHRIIKENLRGRLDEDRIEHYNKILTEVALQASLMERRAEEAERETIKLKKAQYMKAHIGDSFTGVVSGVTKWGIYVELPNTVEGMIHVSSLTDDFYAYNENRYELIGERTGKVYQLGQVLTIEVSDVDTFRRTIDFTLVDPLDQSALDIDIYGE